MQDRCTGQLGNIALVVFVALLLTVAGNAQGQSSSSDEHNALMTFFYGCPSDEDDNAFVDVTFAPVRKLESNEQSQGGTWQSEFIEMKYPDNIYDLTRGNRIDMVSSLVPPKKGTLPRYLWHLISVPKAFNENEDIVGYIPFLKKAFEAEMPPVWNDYDLSTLHQSRMLYPSSKDEEKKLFFIYLHSNLEQRQSTIREVRAVWERTVGKSTFQNLVAESFTVTTPSYDHTFIYQDVPQCVECIRTDGDRRDSSRSVTKPGKAFGFVLSDSGKCLARTTLKLVR